MNHEFTVLFSRKYGGCFLNKFTRSLNRLENPASTWKQLGIQKHKEN
jgi:hypothetical protein